MHDSRLAIIAYYLMECINNGKYHKALDPIKSELINQLEIDIKGYYSGALDLGLDIAIEHNLKDSYLTTLTILREEISKKGEFISKQQCEKIDKLSDHYMQTQYFEDVPVNEIINWIKKVESLIEN